MINVTHDCKLGSRVRQTSDSTPSDTQHVNCCTGELQESWGNILGDIPTFTTLNCSYCSLAGSLPASWGQSFRNLEVLDLSNLNLADFEDVTFNTTMPAGGHDSCLTLCATHGMPVPMQALTV